MNEENTVEIVKEVAVEVAKEAYKDGGKAVVQPTGELLGLLPRVIKAALAPVEKWVLQQEYSVSETKKLLEEKLKNVPQEMIETPEPHIAVPALQYISYCMDNDELRNMYANLLASSMVSVVKKGVHPGFVEIIKQLCPDEARILRYFSTNKTIPTVTVRYERESKGGIDVIKNFSNVGELVGCEMTLEINKYFDNMIRLGLIVASPVMSSLTNKELYEPLKNHPFILANIERIKDEDVHSKGYVKADIIEGYLSLTDYGVAFCNICIAGI